MNSCLLEECKENRVSSISTCESSLRMKGYDGEVCSICYMEYHRGQKIRVMPNCNH